MATVPEALTNFAKSYNIPSFPGGGMTNNDLSDYMVKKWGEYTKSGLTYQLWLQNWQNQRGGTEVFIMPDDMALDFFATYQPI